ncbi:DUF5317 domain-containing protein [Jeotgalibacillus soli]|uniref:Membrane protein n=1 Tax=Jeotgalibacillus soli TaxID=889306 RepID=A0A0C2VMS1_9BACL|nr:DUF5317 domain-containing protein [Jeotgalibacillus soli]KIL45303.1 membrane protein [Jeotgalibacillus soli]
MVFDGILLSFIVGFIRKGNLKGLAQLKLKHGWVFPLLLIFQIFIFLFQNDYEWLANASGYLYISVYIVGLYFLFINRHHKGFVLISIGVFLNFLVIAVNGGRMPVSLEAGALLDPNYLDVLKEDLYAKHAILTEATRLGFLGDIIPLTDPYPRSQIVSIGDVIMNIGVFVFIQYLMLHHIKEKKTEAASIQLKGGEAK